MNDFHFIRPFWFLALIPFSIWLFLALKHHSQRNQWQSLCDEALLPFVLDAHQTNVNRKGLILGSLMALLSIITLAGPTWQRLPVPAFKNTSALVIALDLSRSMDAADIKPSRLTRARYKIADLLKQRRDGQTALLVYANSAFTVTPLTDDIETINSQLAALQTGIMPAQGSRSDLAVNKAIELLQNASLQKGQILLVTDDSELKLDTIAKNYQVSILGVGTEAGAPINRPDGGFLKSAQGNIVLAKLNPQRLSQVAAQNGGIFQKITDTDTDINALSDYFNRLKLNNSLAENDLLLDKWQEAGIYLLIPLLLLASLNFRRGLLALLCVSCLPYSPSSQALEWQDLWQTPDQQAQQAFNRGDFKTAAEKFTQSDWQAAAAYKAKQPENLLAADNATAFYNQANVLAQSGQLDAAIKAYDKALVLEPSHQDALYNKEIVEKALEKQKNDSKDSKKDKQQQNQTQQNKDKPSDSEQEQANQSKPQETQQKSQDTDNASENNEAAQKQAEQDAKQQKAAEDKQPQDKAETQIKASKQVESEDNEKQQANAQWLKRIPDDPSGLLKRKFLYQYGRQPQKNNSKQQW